MKTFILFFIIMASAVNVFPQSNTIETGLYLVVPRDSCSGQNNIHSIVYAADTLCLAQDPVITVNDVESCSADSTSLDGKEAYTLNIKLTKFSTSKFKEITENNVGKRLAMIIDDTVVMAAVIRDPITSGMLTISGEERPIIKTWEIKLKQEVGDR